MIPKPPKHKRRRPKNNPVPTEIEQCFICERWGYMQTHECFGGRPNRQLSIKYGLQVKLCDTCHRDITEERLPGFKKQIQQWGQWKFEETHSRAEFMQMFGKNYLD